MYSIIQDNDIVRHRLRRFMDGTVIEEAITIPAGTVIATHNFADTTRQHCEKIAKCHKDTQFHVEPELP